MKKKMKSIAAIVVAYNIEKNILLENINSYYNYVDKIVIIDNSDRKNNLQECESEEKITYICLGGNFGIAKALNKGIEYAIDNDFNYVLTMDQDSKFNNNIIDEYRKFEKDNVIIYSPNYYIERKKNKKYKENTKELYWTMTSGNILNLELYKKVGPFREDFFIDGVDYEYCLRARKLGYKILQCNNAILFHNPGVTKIKKILSIEYKYGYMSPTRMYYQVRNLSYIAKEYKSLKAYGIIWIKFLKILLLFDNKKEFFISFNKGIKDFKNNKFGGVDKK